MDRECVVPAANSHIRILPGLPKAVVDSSQLNVFSVQVSDGCVPFNRRGAILCGFVRHNGLLGEESGLGRT